MKRSLLLGLALATVCGCGTTVGEICHDIILPEQRTIDYHDPANLPPARIPNNVEPRTVANPKGDAAEWQMSLDEAIHIAVENCKVIRVLAGTTAVSSGQTIYDAAITNTQIDAAQGRFDPTFQQNNLWNHTNTPEGTFNPFPPFQPILESSPTEGYMSTVGMTKTNVLGGQFGVNYVENPVHNGSSFVPLTLDQTHSVQLSYTQPLLQGAGYQANMAPVVIARLNTEQSYFQMKDSVQEMVRGVIQAYWNLVQARINLWAVKNQVDLSAESLKQQEAQREVGLGKRTDLFQARVTYAQFLASLKAAEAAVLDNEAALRNLLGLPPNDDRRIVPTSERTTKRLEWNWDELLQLAEERRPDIVELKLVTEADKQRLIQSENQALPQLNFVSTYGWNGLSGTLFNGDKIATGLGNYPDWSVGINFSVPLGLRAGRANVRNQKLIIARDQANVEQGVHAAMHELAGTIRNLESSYAQYVAYRDTRKAAYENLNLQIAQFQVGNVIYLNVLTALNDWGTAVESEAQQLLAYNVALATLERQTGTILETHGLVFNEERFGAPGPLLCRDRKYPKAQPPFGAPQLYPSMGKPSEDAFDLTKPDWRNAK